MNSSSCSCHKHNIFLISIEAACSLTQIVVIFVLVNLLDLTGPIAKKHQNKDMYLGMQKMTL